MMNFSRFADGKARFYALKHKQSDMYRFGSGYTSEVLKADSFQCHLDANLERRDDEIVIRVELSVRIDKVFDPPHTSRAKQ